MSDDLLLDVIARSIGRTITQENYRQRAADVLRSVKENDLTLPQPTNLIEHEITRLRADLAAVTEERDRMREALRPFADAADDFIAEKHDAHRAIVTLGDLRRARAALEGVTEPAKGESNA